LGDLALPVPVRGKHTVHRHDAWVARRGLAHGGGSRRNRVLGGHDGIVRAMGLLRACHPGPTAAVSLLMTALAVAWGRGVVGSVLVFVSVLAGQLSIGWSNDLIDADR